MERSLEAEPTQGALLGKVLHLVAISAFVLMAAWLAVSAFKLGTANVYSYALQAWHQRWQKDYTSELNGPNLQVAEQVAQEMLAWRAEDAFYQTLTAKQVEWRNFYQLVLSEANDKTSLQQRNLDQAFWHYQQAATLRPSWPNTYVDMANNRAAKGEPSSQWFGYLEKSLAIGPSTQASLVGTVNLGVANWQSLSPEQQAKVNQALLNLVDEPQMLSLYSRQAKPELLKQRICYLLEYQQHPVRPSFCIGGQ